MLREKQSELTISIPKDKFDKKYHFKEMENDRDKAFWKHVKKCEVDPSEFTNKDFWNWDCCNNCMYTDIRESTGCSWCNFKMEPVGMDICDLYKRGFETNRILWKLSYWFWQIWMEDKKLEILNEVNLEKEV
jgi:hypothetical protein